MERVIVFLLSQVLERSSEEEALFSLHPRTESCKLMWRDGQAVGFYTMKSKGRMANEGGRGELEGWRAPFCRSRTDLGLQMAAIHIQQQENRHVQKMGR